MKNTKKYTTCEATASDLNILYSHSALTIEGLIVDEANLDALYCWLVDNGCNPREDIPFYIIYGETMNSRYGLTGDNAYCDDLTIVCVDLHDLLDETPVAARFEIGARWFDDVVDNNRRREEEKVA